LTMPETVGGVEFDHLYRSATSEAAEVGGDFYDLFELEHDRIGIIMGDVSGKGLDAATLTSLVKNCIKAYAHHEKSPASILAKTNQVVARSTGESFITVFFGTLDKRSGILVYSNAGHPPPLVKRRTTVEPLATFFSPAIGVFEGLSYKEQSHELQRGDCLVLYTDGLIEARRQRELFGQGRLIDRLTHCPEPGAMKLPLFLYRQATEFSGAVFADDIAILTVALGDH
jgi:phosphoserine phosphatase RsbU/P